MYRKWEYCSVDMSDIEFSELDIVIDGFTRQGWEISPHSEAQGAAPALQIVLRRLKAGEAGRVPIASS